MKAPVYLDHNATTPLDPAAFEAMLPWLQERWGNPSSRHAFGRAAREALDIARRQVAEAVNAHPTEVFFTSGGSEANNLFLKGVMALNPPGIVATSAIEHACVLQPVRQNRRQGWRLRLIGVDENGYLDETDFALALHEKPSVVSIMLANNETGAVQNVAELAKQVSDGWVHSDAIQAFGKIEVDFRELNRAGVHAITLSSHKIFGPQGAAALVIDKRIDLAPLIAGGGQEGGLRSGTENIAAIAGFGAACTQVHKRLKESAPRLSVLRDRLESEILKLGAHLFGVVCDGRPRLPNTSYFAFSGLDGDALLGELDRRGFMVGSGAACSSSDPKPSHVLLAMGVDPDLARGAIRVSLGSDQGEAEVDGFLRALQESVLTLRRFSALAV